MIHFGVICPPYPGHLNPLSALGRELQSRGHRVTFLQIPDLELKVRSEGMEFHAIGESTYQPGRMAKNFVQLAKLNEIEALQYSLIFCQEMAEMLCQDAPRAIAEVGIEVLLVDQLEIVGETIAQGLDMPFICISSGQTIHRRADVPPFFTPWEYHDRWWARLQNQVAYYLLDRNCQPILQVINHYRQKWNLPPYRQIYKSEARLAHISQQPAAFDFPIPNLPPQLHYVGPLRNQSPQTAPFPFERLTGQPMIYASLGSVQNTKQDVFHCIASACQGLDVQLVIAHGGGLDRAAVASLPGNPLVVEYTPQLEVLAHASLAITHAGMNTILDALSFGVPLVATPITFEQPGNAARIRYTGTGEVIPITSLTSENLQAAIQQVLATPSYRQNAQRIQQAIAEAGGARRAADLIESRLNSERPVPATAVSER